jgi:hypothetical protein
VASTSIAQNLAFVNWTVLTGLALGSYGAVVLLRRRTSATSGFLGFTAACAVVFGLLAWLSDGALPLLIVDSPVTDDPAWAQPRATALLVFCGLAALAIVVRRIRPAAGAWLELAALGAGIVALVFAALSWGGVSATGVSALLLQLVLVTAAAGGVFAAMILGHWYLVTPKLPESPLILLSRALLFVVAAQIVLFWVWIGTGAGPAPDDAPFAALTGPYALFVWLRLIVGLIFPLVVSWAAVQTARTRSMESATGLQYINVGSILAGTIVAAGLYFGAGLLV